MTLALIIVDLQNDFMPGGALAVAAGDETVPLANQLMARYPIVVATQDWHPAEHASFAANHPGRQPFELIEVDGLDQVLWPVHCVQHTPGADFHPELDLSGIMRVFPKGSAPRLDSYSGFFDNGHRQATGLGDWLRAQGVTAVDVLGVATDYCVTFTAIDAAHDGFATRLLLPACRGVELAPGDIQRAIDSAIAAGVTVITDLKELDHART
jgi:nicotinamidase/pyrazinamidase